MMGGMRHTPQLDIARRLRHNFGGLIGEDFDTWR
jgi:hypothetical protein